MKKKFKGNLHTHTTNSDGDAKPEHVAGWYESNGYNFLCLSDHNHLTILNDSDNNKDETKEKYRNPVKIKKMNVNQRKKINIMK